MVTKTLDEFEMAEPEKEQYIDISGQNILQKEGVFWIQKQRQLHSMHHICPYQASFPPQIPAFFIEHYSKEGDVVFDPFCGRGTTILEANFRKRVGIGVDVSPLAIQLAKVKLKKVTFEKVEKRLGEIDFSKTNIKDYESFKDIYHKNTYSQLLNIRKQLRKTPIDNFIKAIILGRLHGHSKNFFSVFTFNVISPKPEAIAKQNIKHKGEVDERNIVPRILIKAKTVLKDPIPEVKDSWVKLSDSRKLPLEDRSVDLIVTSPPFLAVINYIDDNWLRFWFLGYTEKDMDKLRKKLVQTPNIEEYKKFLKASIYEMDRVLKRGKYCIIEVGDVAHKSKKLNLDEVIIELTEGTKLKVKEILVNYISSPKISKAFSTNAKKKGTKTNRCVVMKKR
jgi:DNA modification methylase